MADKVYAFKPEQGRLPGGSFEKQVEYFLNHLRGSVTEEITALTELVNKLLDNYNNLSARVTALQDSVNGYENRIAALETDNNTNKNNITALQNNVSTISNTLTALQTTVNRHTTSINNLTNSISMIESTVETHEEQITELVSNVSELVDDVNAMENTVEELRTIVIAGRHASVYFSGKTETEGAAAWYKVAETEAVASDATLQFNLLAQPVGKQEGPAFTWVVETDAKNVTSTGYADEAVPDGMADNFVVTSWAEEDDGEEITGYAFQIQFQTAGGSGSNGWTDWTTVEVPADTSSTTFAWNTELEVGTEVTGLVSGETNVRVRLSEEDENIIEGKLDGSMELTLSDGAVISITSCAPDATGTGLTTSGSFTPAATEATYSRCFALWCRINATTDTGWKFTVDAEASRDNLDSTVWNLYQVEDYETEDGIVEGVDAIPDTETIHATTFKNPVPDGLIALVNSDTAPDGFALCDGTDDTPDLSAYATETLHYVQKA